MRFISCRKKENKKITDLSFVSLMQKEFIMISIQNIFTLVNKANNVISMLEEKDVLKRVLTF